MLFYEIKAKEDENLTKIQRSLKDSRAYVRRVNGMLLAGTGDEHTTFIQGLTKQFSGDCRLITKQELKDMLPPRSHIPKGQYTDSQGRIWYDNLAMACFEMSSNPEIRKKRGQSVIAANKLKRKDLKVRKPRNSKVEAIGRLEPNQDFNLTGAIFSLKALETRLLEAYNQVSDLAKNLEKVAEYKKLLADKQEYFNAAKMILASEA